MEDLDPKKPLNIPLLDSTVEAAAGSPPEKRSAAARVLRDLQNDPSTWRQVVTILDNSQLLSTKLFALEILEGVIKDRWNKLPTRECEAVENYISDTMSELSRSEASFRQQWLYVCKLDKILVQMLKYYSQSSVVSFIGNIVTAAKSSDTEFENCMIVLKLLSEEYLSGGEMSQNKVQERKSLLISKFSPIYELCVQALSSIEKTELIISTLAMWCSSISWLPIDLIFRPPLLEKVLEIFPNAQYRNLTIQCLCEIASLNVGEFYQKEIVNMYKSFMQQLEFIPFQTIVDAYADASSEDQAFIHKLALFFTSLFKNHIHTLEQEVTNRTVLLQGLRHLVKISHVTETLKVCLEFWNIFALRLFEENEMEPSTGYRQAIHGVGNEADTIVQQRRLLYPGLILELRELMIICKANHQEVFILQVSSDILIRMESISLSDDEITERLLKLIVKEDGEMIEDIFFKTWSAPQRRQFYESTLFRLPVPRLIEGNFGIANIKNSVVFDTTNLDTIKENYLMAINKYRSWQLAGSDKVYKFGPGGHKVWVTRKDETFVFWYKFKKIEVGLVIDGQTGWVEGFLRRIRSEDNILTYKPPLQFSRKGGAFTEETKVRKSQTKKSELEHSYIKSKDLEILDGIGGTYFGSVCHLKLSPFKVIAGIISVYDYTTIFSHSASDTLVLYAPEAGKNSLVLQFTMESLGAVNKPIQIPLSLDATVTKHDKVSTQVRDAIESLMNETVKVDNKQHFEIVEGAPFRTLLQCVEAYRILKRKTCHPTKFFLEDSEAEFHKQKKRQRVERQRKESNDEHYERKCAEDVRAGTLYRDDLHGGDSTEAVLFPMPPSPSSKRKWFQYLD